MYEDKSRKEIFNITSAGVLIHTGNLARGGLLNFLLVELIDEEGCPWGIPAGRSEIGEITPEEVAIREVREETGLEINPSNLRSFLFLDSKKCQVDNATFVTRRKTVFSYQAELSEIMELGDWKFSEGVYVLELQTGGDEEVGRLALMNSSDLFQRKHPIVQRYYRWDIWHGIKGGLEGLQII